jgi:hypothetical protein
MSGPFVDPETEGTEETGTRRRIGGYSSAGTPEPDTGSAEHSPMEEAAPDIAAGGDVMEHDQYEVERNEYEEIAEPAAVDRRPTAADTDPTRLLRRSARRKERVPTAGGSTLHLLVLSSTIEDTTVVDLATRTVMRVRVPWPEGHEPDISTFDVVEVTLAEDPERDDLARPEATTVADLPRHVGTLRGRHLRKLLRRLVASPDGPLLGFPGPSAPYWEFRGFRPSVALIEPTRRPQLIRRQADGTTWVRFGWDRDDVWLPVEDRNAARALDAARRERLSGKSLSTALGFEPQYLLVTVSPPRDGHCYKVCAAVLPQG